MKLRPDLVSTRTTRGETVLDTATGNFWQFNATGAFILERLRAGLDATGIARDLVHRYGLSTVEAARDTEVFLADLARKGLCVDGQG